MKLELTMIFYISYREVVAGNIYFFK